VHPLYKSPAVQAAEICGAMADVLTLHEDSRDPIPGDFEQLALQMINLDLQDPNFAFLQHLTFFTVNTDLEIVQDWARDTVPAFPQRGIVQLRTPPLIFYSECILLSLVSGLAYKSAPAELRLKAISQELDVKVKGGTMFSGRTIVRKPAKDV
ncbi:hypothetical protein FIBSPDRAFT_905564, partial [Athelia psychrophila]